MIFWVLWFIGIVITLVTRIAIEELSESKGNDICKMSISTKIKMHILAILSISLVGGIAVGKFLGYNCNVEKCSIWEVIFAVIFSAVLTYVCGYYILGLKHFKSILSNICFAIVFIISIIGWTILICNYNRNIEEITDTVIKSTQERQLLYYCNIPVQAISGKTSGTLVMGSGKISGSISTSDELSYWYVNENNEGIYDSATANSSKIVFINDEETPHLKIISYCKYKKTINHNNGKEKSEIDEEWKEYIFYLPETIMQYSIE